MSKRVLVVDDSPLARQLVRAAVSAVLGATEFTEAEDGAAALRLLVVKEYDLVVCDLNMPVMDGHALLARLRGIGHHRRTPVVVLSSLVNDAKVVQLRAAGADVVLKKPFTNHQIRDTLKQVGL